MNYSRKIREQKVKELENNKEFMDYARKHHEECKRVGAMGGYKPFEEYLISEIFNLCDDFKLMQFLKTADKKTIGNVLEMALEGI